MFAVQYFIIAEELRLPQLQLMIEKNSAVLPQTTEAHMHIIFMLFKGQFIFLDNLEN